MLSRCDDRFSNLLGLTVGDGGDLVKRESLDSTENESFSIFALSAFEGPFNYRDHLVGGGDVLRRGQTAIGDNVFLSQSLVRLMILQMRFVAAALVAPSGGPT